MIGERAPEFTLPDTSGEEHTLQGPAVVVFTCNHCPYALAWHDRLARAAADYCGRVGFYAINPNDAEREGPWPMPYLRDETQEVARAYGAKTTPDVFVLDADLVLRYRGAPDPDHEDPSLDASWLREAIDQMLAGEDVARPETDPVGCSVKWK